MKRSISVIISMYKNLEYLKLVLYSLEVQLFKDFEVIIAEDDNDILVSDFLSNYSKNVFFPIKHVNQDDKGFRKTRILNKAIKVSEGSILVFVDSDCILEKRFLAEHYKNKKKKTIIFGRRVFLSKKITDKLLLTKDLSKITFINLFFTHSTFLKEGIYSNALNRLSKKFKGVKGCNMSMYRDELISINGFDEDYVSAGAGEDDDIAWRFAKAGFSFKSVKNLAIEYHLDHSRPNRSDELNMSRKMLKQKIKDNVIFCKNGLNI